MTSPSHLVSDLPLAAKIIYGAAIFFLMGITVRYGPQVSGDRLPMQWALDGTPTWFAPRLVSLWGLFGVTTIVGVTFVWAARQSSQASSSLWWALILLSLVMAMAQSFHIFALLRWAGR